MVEHRLLGRRSGVRPATERNGAQPSTAAAGVSAEEGFASDVDLFPKPAGFGTEATTSDQASVLIDEYVVPPRTVAEVTEVALSVASNGQARVSVSGVTYGPYTGAADVTVPLDGSQLTEGDRVRVFHQSTDGTETSTLAQLVALEV